MGMPAPGATTIDFPFVIPLEDALTHSPQAAPATTNQYNSEYAIGTAERCWNLNSALDGTTANEAEWMGVKLTGNGGEFVWTISSGTASQRTVAATGVTTCTPSTTFLQKVTFKMDYTGMASTCVQSKDVTGGDSGSFFLLVPATDQVGIWPSTEDIPTGCPTCAATAPAPGLHFSAAVASFVALLNMLMYG